MLGSLTKELILVLHTCDSTNMLTNSAVRQDHKMDLLAKGVAAAATTTEPAADYTFHVCITMT
jgi:hypothetical protein